MNTDKYVMLLDDFSRCVGCGNVRSPSYQVAPCGHVLCQKCADRPICPFPQCGKQVQGRQYNRVMTAEAEEHLRFKCTECNAEFDTDGAFLHMCGDPLVVRYRPVFPDMPDERFLAVLQPLRDKDDETITDALLVEAALYEQEQEEEKKKENPPPVAVLPLQEKVAEVKPPPPLAAAPAAVAHPAKRRPVTIVLWDYENLKPTFWGQSLLSQFVVGIQKFLKKSGIASGAVEITAYLVVGQDYKVIAQRLSKLVVRMSLSEAKKEAADRSIEHDMVMFARLLDENDNIVLISSDQDFTKKVKEVRDEYGIEVFTIHAAPKGSDHEAAIELQSTKAIHITDVVPEWRREIEEYVRGEANTNFKGAHRGPPPPFSQAVAAAAAMTERQPQPQQMLQAKQKRGFEIVVDGAIHWSFEFAPNKGLAIAKNGFGQLCKRQDLHNIGMCNYLHPAFTKETAELSNVRRPFGKQKPEVFLDDETEKDDNDEDTVVVQGRKIARSLLLDNIGLQLFLDGEKMIGFCEDTSPHNPIECIALHRTKAKKVLVDGITIETAVLTKTRGLQFLELNPHIEGHICTLVDEHDVSSCMHIHLDIKVPGNAYPLPVTRFIVNAGLKQAIVAQGCTGSFCKLNVPHSKWSCAMLHPRRSADDAPPQKR